MMELNKEVYEAPATEVVEVSTESSLLQESGQQKQSATRMSYESEEW